MADVLVWVDGFDYYTVNEFGRRYTTSTMDNANATGRFGGLAANFTNAGLVEQVFSSTSQSWRIGFALNLQAQSGVTFTPFQIRDAGSGQVGLNWIATTRNFQFSRNGTLVGSAGATNLSLDLWYWIEMYLTIKDSIALGECQLYINGALEINLAATTDTKNTANAFGNSLQITGANSWTYWLDDLFVYQMDTTTTPTFLGEHRVQTLYPSGNGNYSQFTGSDGNSTNNYLLVDETTTGDADYVEDATVSDRDSYAMGDLTGTVGTIKAVQISAQMRKDDAGAKTAKLFHRISGTDYDGSNISPLSSFTIVTHLLESSPATATAWTSSEVNGLEAGVKVQA